MNATFTNTRCNYKKTRARLFFSFAFLTLAGVPAVSVLQFHSPNGRPRLG